MGRETFETIVGSWLAIEQHADLYARARRIEVEGVHLGVLDLLADHEQVLDELCMGASLCGALDDLGVPAVVR